MKLKKTIIRIDCLDEKKLIRRAEEHRKKLFDYYRLRDRTWEPDFN